jgi:hypothetical protein
LQSGTTRDLAQISHNNLDKNGQASRKGTADDDSKGGKNDANYGLYNSTANIVSNNKKVRDPIKDDAGENPKRASSTQEDFRENEQNDSRKNNAGGGSLGGFVSGTANDMKALEKMQSLSAQNFNAGSAGQQQLLNIDEGPFIVNAGR